MNLRAFWPYYGAKWRAAPRYPVPVYDTIIEPFAGAAGYATRYHERKVFLIDADPVIAGLWQYLINVKATEIRALPAAVEHLDDVKACQEARWLIGFWLQPGSRNIKKTPSTWAKSRPGDGRFWGAKVIERVASQVEAIRHWQVTHASFESAPDIEATWYVDPPYAGKPGRTYRKNKVDFAALGTWCQRRRGQVIVCENAGADWLPFRELARLKARSGYTHEAIWTNDMRPVAAEEAA